MRLHSSTRGLGDGRGKGRGREREMARRGVQKKKRGNPMCAGN